MNSMDQSRLNPEQQAQLFEMLKQSGQQPTSGGIPVQNGMPMPQQQAAPQQEQQMPAPGSFKDDPEGAMKFLMAKASGPQLQQGSQGLYTNIRHTQPLLGLFGMKQRMPVNEPDYFGAIQQAGLSDFIPQGVPRTPEGMPYINAKTADQIRQLAGQKKGGVNVGDLREEIFRKAPTLKGMLTAPITDPNQAQVLVSTFGIKERSPFYTSKGFDVETGMPVAYDAASNKWFKGDNEVPASEVTQLLSNVIKNVPAGEMNKLSLLNTRLSQIKSFNDTFDPESWGLIDGSLNKTLAFYTDKEPAKAEQYKNLYDIVADIVHERYGANLTQNELSQKVDSIMTKYQSASAIKAFVKIQEARSKTEKNNRVKAL